MTDGKNDSDGNHEKAVTMVIDFYNKYSGCIVFAIFTMAGYFGQSKRAKIHEIFVEIDKIARTELKIGIENLNTTRYFF